MTGSNPNPPLNRPDVLPAILPPGTTPLESKYKNSWQPAFDEVKMGLELGTIPAADAYELLEALPSETLRELVNRIAGLEASFLTTFTRQIRLTDAVLTQLVYPDGRIRETASEAGISLKDALTMSTRISQMLIKDLPKLYTVDRIQRTERAFGDVIEEFLTPELQEKVLNRLAELTKDINR